MRVELSSTTSNQEVGKMSRHILWIIARQDKKGKFKDAEVEKVAERIMESDKKQSDDSFISEGSNDVLTEVLGNSEHRGRTRAIGSVKHQAFFKLPPGRRGRKKLAEELVVLLAKEKMKWQQEIDKKYSEDLQGIRENHRQDIAKTEEKFSSKFAQLEARLEAKSPTTLVSTIGLSKSAEGSCSRQAERGEVFRAYEAVKKKLLLDVNPDPKELQPLPEDDVGNLENTIESPPLSFRDASTDSAGSEEELKKKRPTDIKLAVDSLENIVALGRVVKSATLDPNQQMIHGKPLGAENIRVEVAVPLKGDAALPYPVKGEMELVKEVVGSIVAWPKNLSVDMAENSVVDVDNEEKTKKKSRLGRKKTEEN